MVDMNMVVAENIISILKLQNKKQSELVEAVGVNKQIFNKMLNGSRMINAIELKRIADFLGVKTVELTRIPKSSIESDIVHVFKVKIDSKEAKEAVKTADILSDMILFHKNVRENGIAMEEEWDS